jgi:hypothetical protein
LRVQNIPLQTYEDSVKLILKKALTKSKRQELLAGFFKSVFAEVRKFPMDMDCSLHIFK